MIFKQIIEIISGKKTQTRRIVKEGEVYDDFDRAVYTTSAGPFHWNWAPKRHLKWMVGHTYAVCPGRGLHTEMVHRDGFHFTPVRIDDGYYYDGDGHWFSPDECKPLRIRITAIRQERLGDISEADCLAEGGVSWWSEHEGPQLLRAGYAELWDSINTRKGTRWMDNPLVWVLTFEVVK
jgi:hypothetical protein